MTSELLDCDLDVLYWMLDALLVAKAFEAINDLFCCHAPSSLSTDMILCLLIATHCVKSKLPSRVDFLAEAETAIKERGDWESGLFNGLK